MTFSPIEHTASLRIGSVEFVSPDEIKVCLDIEAPDGVSANAGVPRAFPRINSYVLIATEAGYIVAQVEWIAIEKTPFPKRKGFQDYGLVDLPFPTRKMRANPLGLLKVTTADKFEFQRGVQSFPNIGEPVLIPTDSQLKAIIESGANRRIKIGTSPVAANAEVKVDPDRLFGRHLAVLGNTGSGKSCSVAGLIQWSLTEAEKSKTPPNARFIIIDPNGEYSRVFCTEKSKHKARLFKVDDKTLKVPLWFWNSSEWCSFSQASGKTQRPLLRQALREVKAGKCGSASSTKEEKKLELRRYLSSNCISVISDLQNNGIKDEPTKFGFKLKAIKEDLSIRAGNSPESSASLLKVTAAIDVALGKCYKEFPEKGTGKLITYYKAFEEAQVNCIITEMEAGLSQLGGVVYTDGPNEDMPLEYNGAVLADHLQMLGIQQNTSQFVDLLVMRIRAMLSDDRTSNIICDSKVTLSDWLHNHIGGNNAENGAITVIDLSLVPAEIIHLVTAIIARIIFEALQRYRKVEERHKPLPTVLVMEEAHNFIKRYKEDTETYDAAYVCCQIFEKIAREGRKFGLGLVLSSQRPSELSPTVLSQCNTFLLHRISNDKDQELVSRLVPDNLRGLLRELPSLPSQYAILLGWASELPIMVRMNDLAGYERPHSEDPDFWDVWTGKDKDGKPLERNVNWQKIADEWQGKQKQATPVPKKPAKKA